jgi:hypothetical protein
MALYCWQVQENVSNYFVLRYGRYRRKYQIIVYSKNVIKLFAVSKRN